MATPRYNTYVGMRYVPIFDGEWDRTKTYEPLTIVSYQGNSYTSRTFIPVGMDINNTEYWALTGNYNAQVEYYRQETARVAENMLNYVKSFNTVSAMIADTDLGSGEVCHTNGYNSVGDNGGCFYIVGDSAVTNKQNIELANGRYATMVDGEYVTPEMFGAVGDGVADDTTAIAQAISYASTNGIRTVKLRTAKYLISDTLSLPSKVTLLGENDDISVYKYNQGFTNVFNTEIILAPNSNCNVIEFESDSYSNSVEAIFINGNKSTNTDSTGIKLTGTADYRGRQKIKNVMVFNCSESGIEVGEHNFEVEITSCMCFYCKNGIVLSGEDCVLQEYSAGYNTESGITINKHGALRAFNIDSFGNGDYGILAYDCTALSFIKATINSNGKNNVCLTYTPSTGNLPGQVIFTNSSIFNCAENYSEVIIKDAPNFGPFMLNFIGCVLGARARATSARYIIENTAATKLPISITGGAIFTANYIAISENLQLIKLVNTVGSDGREIVIPYLPKINQLISNSVILMKEGQVVTFQIRGYAQITDIVALTIPEEYRPRYAINAPAWLQTGSAVMLHIGSEGEITCTASTGYIGFCITYMTDK